MPDKPEFDKVVAAAARFQELLSDAVLVGGTAAAQYAGHRLTFDADHVLVVLRDRFDTLLDALEASRPASACRRSAATSKRSAATCGSSAELPDGGRSEPDTEVELRIGPPP